MQSANKKNVSVVICCYNSALRLPETLRHLALQEVPEDFGWEVIIVDNNSSDDTASVAEKLWHQHGSPAPLKVVQETRPGLSYARKKGASESLGDYLIFCDDDNWLSQDYLYSCAHIFNSNPEVAIIGGHGIAHFEVPPPQWIVKHSLSKFAVGPQAQAEGFTPQQKPWVYGAGMAIRKSVFLIIDNKPSYLSDRKGKAMSSGGDVEICYKALLMGYQIWYDPKLTFQHFIPKERLSFKYLLKMTMGNQYGSIIIKAYKMAYSESYLLINQPIWWYLVKEKTSNSFLSPKKNTKLLPISIINKAGAFKYIFLLLTLNSKYDIIFIKIIGQYNEGYLTNTTFNPV